MQYNVWLWSRIMQELFQHRKTGRERMSRVEDRKRGNRYIIFWPALPWLVLECSMALSQSAPKPESDQIQTHLRWGKSSTGVCSLWVTGYCAFVQSIQTRNGPECRMEIHFILHYRMSKLAVTYSKPLLFKPSTWCWTWRRKWH